jgi:hypothetical protein
MPAHTKPPGKLSLGLKKMQTTGGGKNRQRLSSKNFFHTRDPTIEIISFTKAVSKKKKNSTTGQGHSAIKLNALK